MAHPARHNPGMSPAIWESDRPTRSASTWWIPLVLGLLIAVAQIQLVVAAWESCGISAATGLTTTSLYALGVPALTFLNWLLVALPAEVWLAKRTRAGNRWFLTVVTSAVLVGAETLVLGYYVATPTEPVSTSCRDNVPDWWPEQVPV